MDSQMEDTTEAMPYAVAPFALMIEYALFLAEFASSWGEGDEGGRRSLREEPPILAEDQATCRSLEINYGGKAERTDKLRITVFA
jgi:hypothetical protein